LFVTLLFVVSTGEFFFREELDGWVESIGQAVSHL
jgi:hypothetical protein